MYYSTRFKAETIRAALIDDHSRGMRMRDLRAKYRLAKSTIYRWIKRPSVLTRSSRPHRQPRRLHPQIEQRILAARQADASRAKPPQQSVGHPSVHDLQSAQAARHQPLVPQDRVAGSTVRAPGSGRSRPRRREKARCHRAFRPALLGPWTRRVPTPHDRRPLACALR